MTDETSRIIPDGAIDVPSKDDYNGDTLLEVCSGSEIKKWPEEEAIVFDQESTPACTRYGATHLNNGQNILEYRENGQKYEQKDPRGVWDRSDHVKFLVSAMEQQKKGGMIEGYAPISKTIESFKKAIDAGFFIYTGVYGVKWGPTNFKPYTIVIGTEGIGHAFAIVSYDDITQKFKFINSFGPERGDHGYNYINYSDIEKLMTSYAVVDKDDSGKFAAYKERQKAINAIMKYKEIFSLVDDEFIRTDAHEKADYLREKFNIDPSEEK